MSELLIYMACLVSVSLSIMSLYVSLSLAKSIKLAHQNLQVLFQVLSRPHPDDGYNDWSEEVRDYPIPADSKVVDMFSRQALEWNDVLNEWVPKTED